MSVNSGLPADIVAELGRLAVAAATQAATYIMSGRPENLTVAATKSSDVDPVTEMDIGAERMLREFFAAHRPGDGLLGEEGGLTPGTTGVTWIVDPIDGTVNYLYGLPNYAVSVAAVWGEPDPTLWTSIAGCVVAPSLGRTWSAVTGQGAFRNGRRLTVNHPDDLGRCLVGTGFGYRAERRAHQGGVVAEILPQVRDIRRAGSAAIDLCMVADGGLDLFYERGLNPWDLAAGALVIQEAGGRVQGLRGRRADSDFLVAGSGDAFGQLVPILERCGADSDG